MYKFFWNLGVIFRNPHLKEYLSFLKKSQKWSIDEYQSYQFKECKSFLIFANKHSKFYNQLFKEVGFNPQIDFNSLSDIKKIPIITKSTLINKNKDIHSDYPFQKKFLCETSGTSGAVLEFYRDEQWDSFNRAAICRGYSWFGINPWDKNGYLWGYQLTQMEILKTRLLDKLQNRFRIFDYSDKGLSRFLKRTKNVKYIEGYSSMLYEIAKRINPSEKNKFSNLKMIKGTSEKVYESYQQSSLNAFGLRIINEYGSAESGIIGFECKHHHIHVNMEGVLLEEIDGEAIVTNYRSRSFPIIRYKLGDYIEVDFNAPKCECGIHTPIIKNIIGRIGKKIYTTNGEFPSLTLYYVFKDIALQHKLHLNYQASQLIKGKLDIKIEQDLNKKQIILLHQVLTKYFKNDLDVNIIPNSSLHAMKGKLVDFISYL